MSSDEVLYNAHIHPEQYSNTLSDAQIAQLHKSLHYVCGLAVETLADSSKFPKEWLFKHRWQKGKKDATMTLEDGTKFVYLTVGGRTSAVVPSVQKKTGPVAKDVDEDGEEAGTKKGGKKRKLASKDEQEDEESAEEKKPAAKKGKAKKTAAKEEDEPDEKPATEGKKPAAKKGKAKTMAAKEEHEPDEKPAAKKGKAKKSAAKEEDEPDENPTNGILSDEEGGEGEGKSELPVRKKKSQAAPKTNGDVAKTPKSKKVKASAVKDESAGRRRSGRVSGKEVSYAED